MAITAAQVKELREKTGAGIMDAKKALVEVDGDMDKAIDLLREKGIAKAAKKADRVAAEGLTGVYVDGNVAALVEVNSETDFVAKNEDFIKLALSFSDLAISQNCSTLEDLKATPYENLTVADKIMETVAKIGEKIDITSFERIDSESVVAYNHAGYRVAVLVALNKPSTEANQSAGKDVAMQIAAMNPVAVDPAAVPAETIAREKDIIMEQMKADPKMAGKPDEMIAKIAEGKLNAFFKENTLMAQPFVKDGGKSVAEYLKSVSGSLKVNSFVRVALG